MFGFGKKTAKYLWAAKELYERLDTHILVMEKLGVNVNRRGENTLKFSYVLGCIAIFKTKIPTRTQTKLIEALETILLQSVDVNPENNKNRNRLKNELEEFLLEIDDVPDVMPLLMIRHLNRLGITDPEKMIYMVKGMNELISRQLFIICVNFIKDTNSKFKLEN